MFMAIDLPTTESEEQSAFVSRVHQVYGTDPDFLPYLFFSTLSGAWIAGSNRQSKGALIAKYKREGWVNGVADLLYLQPRGKYAYLAIEMKTPVRAKEKNGGASDDQLAWLHEATKAGAMAEICHGQDAAWDVFTRYMQLPISRYARPKSNPTTKGKNKK